MYGNIRGEPTVVGRCTHNAAVVRARGTRAVWVRYVPTQRCVAVYCGWGTEGGERGR